LEEVLAVVAAQVVKIARREDAGQVVQLRFTQKWLQK
jgi:hypothetical protein